MNSWSTFSCISYFILENRQIRYLDTFDEVKKFSIYMQSKSGFTILVDLNTNHLTTLSKVRIF